MNATIDFTSPELNALDRLLATIKTEAHLTADEVNFFALSPYIISVLEKVQKANATLRENKEGLSHGYLPFPEFYLENIKERIKNLDESSLTQIKQMSPQEKESFCDVIFAPFKPNDSQKQAIIDQLGSIKN